MTPIEICFFLSTLAAVLPHIAALFGKPEMVKKAKSLSKVLDITAGNYGKAKNLHD